MITLSIDEFVSSLQADGYSEGYRRFVKTQEAEFHTKTLLEPEEWLNDYELWCKDEVN
ncbi:MAG: hypothetical protein ACREBU_01600 [Nitrososphaera sp.]